jgi:pimeloyl-ACP methyl ester carboxylesterase
MRRLLILACALAACHVSSALAHAAALQAGTLRLHRCPGVPGWCGVLPRPLDPAGSVSGRIDVYFEYYPHTGSGAAAGTFVPIEGGPGYPSTESRDAYLALMAPLRADHDLLIMDARGTGRSGAVDCEPLQHSAQLSAGDVGACGRTLGLRARFYSAGQAADDLAALLDALGIARIDLYGDSYGTYAAQVFARRHADRIRSLVLDGAYPLDGEDYPWYPNYAPAMRRKFERACERSSACSALPGGSIAHIAPALGKLRAEPGAVSTRDDEGRPFSFRADAGALAIVMFGASPPYITLRETDAAARAYAQGDTRPLLRLMAEALASTDSRSEDRDPVHFSAGFAAAAFCQDGRQPFDMNLTVEARHLQWDRELTRRAATNPSLYAPFTLDEYRSMPLDYAFIDECIDWPAPGPDEPRLPLIDTHAPAPDIPVLVISGELDDMTSAADGAAAAAQYAHAQHVVIANGLHVNALPHARSDCGADLTRAFLRSLENVDMACAATVPPVRLVPVFAQRLRFMPPATAQEGHEAGELALRAVAAALETCEDALSRALFHGPGTQVGLRGGTFLVAVRPADVQVQLREVRWSEDLAVSGRLVWRGPAETVQARLELHGPDGAQGSLRLLFPPDGMDSAATATGSWQGRPIRARVDF